MAKHIHIHAGSKKTKDIGKPIPELLKIAKDPGIDEREAGKALQELASRGIDIYTGKYVGTVKAKEAARRWGENMPG